MARAKRSSSVLESARQRLAGLKAITPAPSFGPSLQITDYEQEINDFSAKIDRYNGMLSTLDDLQNEIEADEGNLRSKNTRMLSAVEAQFGPDSSQYEQAGGTRRRTANAARRKQRSRPKSLQSDLTLLNSLVYSISKLIRCDALVLATRSMAVTCMT
jgi:hypothetical protein